MIAASAVLVVVAFITLIVGIFQTGLGLIWMSIASSVLAAVFLLLGVVRGRPPRVAAADLSAGGSWGETADGAVPSLDLGPSESDWTPEPAIVLDEPVYADDEIEESAPEPARPARRAAAPRVAAPRVAARSAASRTGASAKSAAARGARSGVAAPKARVPAAQMPVVVIPDRDKFHKDTCRYAKGAGTMTLTKSEARREGYKACGVCKP